MSLMTKVVFETSDCCIFFLYFFFKKSINHILVIAKPVDDYIMVKFGFFFPLRI